MCRSYSSDSQKKDWSKRLSLRGTPRGKEVLMHSRTQVQMLLFVKFIFCKREKKMLWFYVCFGQIYFICLQKSNEKRSLATLKEKTCFLHLIFHVFIAFGNLIVSKITENRFDVSVPLNFFLSFFFYFKKWFCVGERFKFSQGNDTTLDIVAPNTISTNISRITSTSITITSNQFT